jgi:beta-glucanase (GH16 family)
MADIRAILGLFPKTSDYENLRIKLEEEYNNLLAFKNSKELHSYHELETYLKSEEYLQKKKDILSLRFSQTDDFQKEKEFQRLSKAKDIRLYYKTRDSEELKRFQELEKSAELKKYEELDKYIHSTEFAAVKKEASLPAKEKFRRSDLFKTLEQYNSQKSSELIKGYYKFINHPWYADFEDAIAEGLPQKIENLAKDKEAIKEYQALKRTREYKRYHKLLHSPHKHAYDKMHGSDELEAFKDLEDFINSGDFKRKKHEIESFSFKDTEEFKKLEQYQILNNSDSIKFYYKFKNSKELKNYLDLHNSKRIGKFEELKEYISSDEFIRFKAYATKSPKKRWHESKEFEKLQEFESLKESEKIKWYFKNISSKKFDWHRVWSETFFDSFSEKKLDTKKWLTRYFWGDKMFKGSYSLSHDKHFVTDGDNLLIDGGRLHIITRKEEVVGKSWSSSYGFVTRNFGFTSGLINTGNSFQQKYGTFEAKIKFHPSAEIQNAFWMLSKTFVPRIDIANARKKVIFGTAWGDPKAPGSIRNNSKTKKRSKLSSDFFIYSLEWTPLRLTWKINGMEVASTAQGVPAEPMYLLLGCGLQEEINNGILPAMMEIDWVRCYQHKDYKDMEQE